ncbi:mechanosensitive ion channel family protein [Mucilaginibacter ginsenosidivorans]|uniref:Mechanosensitive ion channel n=1 Tax=Mucilaginibacter ginsenosidivorans TaxID=398053 RepID=A0A5B8UVC0_9SPHI|nr:mechanosensitive ion channel [Mucilaginibacter ginsenosidivorans]QEC62872.1 mechanosensitive ion channel [Mucilaginibacter ginsenosidivorans]
MNVEKAYDLIQQTLNNWMQHFIKMLPNILLSAVVLVVGLYVCQWIKRLTRKLTRKISHNAALGNLLVSIIYLSSIGILIFTVLSILQLDKAVTSILAGAGIAGLALAFAFQDIAANFISGIFISFRRPLFVGDIVKIKNYMGRVEEINLRDTVIRTFQGQMVIIPNKDVFQNPIENYTLLGKRRIDLTIGVSYGEDLERVRDITLDAVKDIDGLSEDDEVTMFYQEFGDSSINFIIRLWVNTPEQLVYWTVCSETIIRIKKAYDEHNIMIPFPIRTLDFGIKGGVSLDEVQIKT